MKRPSFQFYPGDWLHDAALGMVSLQARGLWMEMICLMHQGTPYGHLKVNGEVILTDNLACMTRSKLSDVLPALEELKKVGIYDILDDGTIYSRRMIRDEEIRNSRAAGGILGGNKKLLKGKVNHKGKPTPNLPPEEEEEVEVEDEYGFKKGDRSRPESLEKIKEFCASIQLPSNSPEWFLDKMIGSGWKNGGEPIKDWKATLRAWNRAGYLPHQNHNKNGSLFTQKSKVESVEILPPISERK